MRATAFVVTGDVSLVNWLAQLVEDVRFDALRAVSPADFADQFDRISAADMLLFEMDVAEVDRRSQMIEQLLERFPDMPVAAVGREPHPDVVLQAMRAGARDFWVMHRDDATLPQAVTRLLRRGQAPAAAGKLAAQGTLYTLISSHPLESLAFTAAHLGLALVQSNGDSGKRVLLLDCASPAGAASIFLNLTAAYTVLDALSDVYRCDQTLVDTAFVRHGSGLYVLSLPEDMLGAPALDGAMLGRLIGVLRGLFSEIVMVIDGHAGSAVLADVLPLADRLIWLTDQSIVRSRHSKHLLRALRRDGVALPRAGLLIDAYQKRLGLEPEHLAELLELPLIGNVGGDPAARIQAMNTGDSMFRMFPKDGFALDIAALAQTLRSGGDSLTAVKPGGGLFTRWMK